jgi:hypothetical protein
MLRFSITLAHKDEQEKDHMSSSVESFAAVLGLGKEEGVVWAD